MWHRFGKAAVAGAFAVMSLAYLASAQAPPSPAGGGSVVVAGEALAREVTDFDAQLHGGAVEAGEWGRQAENAARFVFSEVHGTSVPVCRGVLGDACAACPVYTGLLRWPPGPGTAAGPPVLRPDLDLPARPVRNL